MRESGLGGLSWAISLFLIVILVGFMAGTVAGEASQSQPDIGFSEPLTVSGPEGSDTTQQDGTIEMDHVQVAVRASKTQVTAGERVQITYDGVAFPGNPEPLNIQIIATIPSGVTASDMRAEGCGPQCPITDQQLRPSDKLSAGSFTITPQEAGDHDIDVRATYTFVNGSTRSWSETTRITISTEPEAPPAPEPGIDEKVVDILESTNPFFVSLVLISAFFLSTIGLFRKSDLELSKIRTEWNPVVIVVITGMVISTLWSIEELIEELIKIGGSEVIYSLALSFILVLSAIFYWILLDISFGEPKRLTIEIFGTIIWIFLTLVTAYLMIDSMLGLGLINTWAGVRVIVFSTFAVGSLLGAVYFVNINSGYYIDGFSLRLQFTIGSQILNIACHLAIYYFYAQFMG